MLRGFIIFDDRGELPVPQLPQVVVLVAATGGPGTQPAEEDVTAGLHEVLTGDHPFTLVGVLRCAGIVGKGRDLGLFGLKEQDVRVPLRLEQQDPRPGTDAAHPDNLVRDVGKGEVIEQASSIRLHGGTVGGEQATDPLEEHVDIEAEQLVDRDDQRRITDDPPPPVNHRGELPDRLQAVASVRLRERGLRGLEAGFLLPQLASGQCGLVLGQGFFDVQVGVPDGKDRLSGQAVHRRA
jgi:hypothetical protein